MTVFDKIREKNKIISALVKFQNSSFYPILFAIVCVISGTHSKAVYLPCIWALTAVVIFSLLFSDDLKVFIVPALLLYYAIGFDSDPSTFLPTIQNSLHFDKSSLPHFITCAALIIVTLICKMISGGYFKKIFKKRGLCLRGILAIDAALLLNGAFSEHWTPMNLVYGLMMGAALTLLYLIFLAILSTSKDLASYACKTLVCLSAMATAQIAIVIIRLYADGSLLLVTDGSISMISRSVIRLSWGVSTIIGAVIALGIPASLYLAKKCRFPILSLSCAVVLLAALFIINTRSALLFGGLIFVAGSIICCFKNKNKIANRIFTISFFSVALCAGTVLLILAKNPTELINNIFSAIRLDFLLDDESTFTGIFGSRAELWIKGFSNFKESPLFGVGFSYAKTALNASSYNVYAHMYHNIVLEFLGSMGIAGILAFLFHLKTVIELGIKKFSLDKLIILLVPLLILTTSLLDNFFFQPNFGIVYALFLAVAEIMLEENQKNISVE